MSYFAFGLGIGTQSSNDEWLEIYYNKPVINPSEALVSAVAATLGYEGGDAAIEICAEQLSDLEAAFLSVGAEDQAEVVEILKGTKQPLVVTILETDSEPATTAEVCQNSPCYRSVWLSHTVLT